MERRRYTRKRAFQTQPELSVQLGSDRFTAKVLDLNEEGLGLEVRRHIDIGCRIRIKGELAQGTALRKVESEGLVRWIVPSTGGKYLCGILLDKSAPVPSFASGDPDYYETLQLSPNADPDTVLRIFRVLAQRFHPDNRDTGDENSFKTLVKAYEVLSDPTRRAAYDAQRPAQQQSRWKLFGNAKAAKGVEAERHKRHGILSLLYVRRANEPREPYMSLLELEQLLGCPREHLEFALWYLKENAWIARTDNGRYSITARGVEQSESNPLNDGRMIEGDVQV